MTVWQDQQPPRSRRAAREMGRADLPEQPTDEPQQQGATFEDAAPSFAPAPTDGVLSRRALRERAQQGEQPADAPAPTGRRAQPAEPDRTTESGEPLNYVTQNRVAPAEAGADGVELPPTEALPTQDAPNYRFRDFSPEARRAQPAFTPPPAPIGTVPTWGAHVAPGENEGQLDYQTAQRAPKPAEPTEHRTMTRRELRALEAQGLLKPAVPEPKADEAEQPVASVVEVPAVKGEQTDDSEQPAVDAPSPSIEALFGPVVDPATPVDEPSQDARAAEPETTESDAEPQDAVEEPAAPVEPESKTARLFGLFASQAKKADRAEAERAELARVEEARRESQRAEAEQLEVARREAEKAEAEHRAAEQRALEERAEQQRLEAERHAAEAAAIAQAAGPATELFDVRADREAAEREAEERARAVERQAAERARREAEARVAPAPLVEPEEPERRPVPSANDLFAALSADVADEQASKTDRFAEFDFITRAGTSPASAEPVSVAGLFADAAEERPSEEQPAAEQEQVVEEPTRTARFGTPAPFTPPKGHWSIQSDIDEMTQPRENISRIIGQGSGAIASNALVLPSIPSADVTAPVAATGEILITGSFDLPPGLATTGSIPERLDSEIDHIVDPGDREQAVTDAAPVRAVRAISSNTSTRGVISAKRPKGSRLPLVLAGSAAVMAASVVGLFIAGWTTGVF